MLQAITEEEIEFMESFYDPIHLAECLFHDLDNLSVFDEDKFGHVRNAQFVLFSFEHLLDEDPKLSDKENFQLRKGAGDVYAFGGRLFGKTLCVEKLDSLCDMVQSDGGHVGFCSYDAIHIKGVIEIMVQVLDNHKFFKMFTPHVIRSPNYRITLPSGYIMESVNMNITGKKPGSQFFQKHFTRLYIEEASFETEEVYRKRRDSVSENGCVFRLAGMTNFTKYSPCGRIFYDLDKRSQLVNLPQYVNPKWDVKEKAKAKKDFGGEQSIGFRVFVRGEVVEEGVSVFDMDRLRKFYNEERILKVFEINKQNFHSFENIIVVEKPKNASITYICADIGESAPTEIIILFQINDIYRYIYNIILYNLTDKEQSKIFKWLGHKVKANFIGLDTTDGTGRAVFRNLEEEFPRENLVWVAFNEKIAIDFERDTNDKIIFEGGKPINKEEYVSEWSVKHLKENLFYGGRVELPFDYKFDIQFNSIVAVQSGNRTVYSCVSDADHLFAAFRVWAIAQWSNEFNLVHPIERKNFSKTGV